MKSTRELEHEIRQSGSPSQLAAEDFQLPPLPEYLGNLLRERGVTVGDVVLRCNLDRSYAYQLFNGTRRPTRDFLLLLALSLSLEGGGGAKAAENCRASAPLRQGPPGRRGPLCPEP